jgi:hypothetical protein
MGSKDLSSLGAKGVLLVAGSLLASGCGDDGSMMTPDGGDMRDTGTSMQDGGGSDDGGGGSEDGGNGEPTMPETYTFESQFIEGESSVAYSGQVFRHVLLNDLTTTIEGMTEEIDSANFPGVDSGIPSEQDQVVDRLNFFYRFDSSTSGSAPIKMSTDPMLLQETYDDIASGKDLVGKTAGNDDVTDYKDWDGGGFMGWSDSSIAAHGGSIDSPQGLITAFFETLEENALGRAGGDTRHGVDGDGNELSEQLPVHVMENGVDLAQMVEKFTRGAVMYSQGADDYLDSGETGVDGKGLQASSTDQDEDAPYSVLEHQYDEGWGYFGGARDYPEYTDEEIAGAGGRDGWSNGYHDTDGDGAIDLNAEFNFGHSGNAADRDLGSSSEAATDFTGKAFEAFLRGRFLVNRAAGRELTSQEMAELEAVRDQAVLNWEKAIAASVVHYINDTLEVMTTFGSGDYDFMNHAKVYSEMKGFALILQFNPRKQLTDSQFMELHTKMGDKPVLPGADSSTIDDYEQALLDARAILKDAYGFAEANMGDETGQGGW